MTLDEVEAKYTLILCDIWGCIHDGVTLYPGAADRLRKWRDGGKTIVLITNAPRPAKTVGRQLQNLGLSRDLWDSIVTGGEVGIAALKKLEWPVGFIGTRADRAILEDNGVAIARNGDFDQLACCGLDETRREVADYDDQIEPLARRGVVFHCLNPDRMVIHGGRSEPCAGAIADRYLEFGGPVEYYGKPYPAIYRHVMNLAGNPSKQQVLAIGDGLLTDILGAAKSGFGCVYVTGGIGQSEPVPDDFAEANALGDWHPVAVVEGLR